MSVTQILSFTLDTNCLIDVEESRTASNAVLRLVEAGRRQEVDIAMVASCASERQVGGSYLEDIATFRDRLERIGFGHVRLLFPIAKWGLCFWGAAIYPTEQEAARETEMFRALFPTTEVTWSQFAKTRGLDAEDLKSKGAWPWRNKLLDAQALWAHEHASRDVFVTSDANFKKRLFGIQSFDRIEIATPVEATGRLLAK